MYFIGDIHGNFRRYQDIIDNYPESIQLGDFGLGFYPENDDFYMSIVDDIPTHRFIRGNHDNPELCEAQPTCLGNFGYLEKESIFYVAGAWSIDKAHRTPGVSWWENEELNYQQFNEAIKLYLEVKPRIFASHDCPMSALPFVAGYPYPNSTSRGFEMMFNEHKPEIWVFGHHHKSRDFEIEGTNFRCLAEFEVEEIK